ncbi:MAG TPA: PIN domain-containing protein [Nitrospirae bacterium]|nr:hypothetical protein BMS3Abin10_00658 [bacterium BMS3Abin10]GBE38810.1 hypothetical protein BMS3Bbin08_01422 [bacterium BMS3Bbin08]HDO25507.1 PIN domain-containing protein [Nitrospirota bacterium]
MAKKRIKVFLDSNVILSGFMSDKGPPRIILDLLSLELPVLAGVTGEYNIIEIERNLKKKMPELWSVYKKYLPDLNLEIIPLPDRKSLEQWSGGINASDMPVLVSAIKAKADYLITGDKDFTGFKGRDKLSFKIITPSKFVDIVIPVIRVRSCFLQN